MKCKVTVDTSHYPKEGPWELPRGWAWCHLSDLASFAGGKTPSMDNKDFWKNGKHLWITSKDMKSRYLIDSQMKISDTAVREMTVFHPGTILMVNRSGILRRTLPLAILNAEATINQDIKAIVPYLLCLSPYLYYAILSQESFILSEYKKAGTTVDNINFDKFISLLIPLPPQKEQDRIVSSINQCFAIIENIDSSQKDLNISLDAAKAKILDLAIRGKLVPQDPNEEPAIELLMRINPDFRPSDNLHYKDCPKGWIIVTVADVFEINPKIQGDEDADAGFVPMTNIRDGFCNMFSFEVRKWAKIKNGFTRFANGDIAVAKISPCLENRKSVIMRDLPNGIGAGTTELNIFRSRVVDPEYGLLFFKSKYFINSCAGSYNGVVGQQRVSRSLIEEMQFLLPPLEEQKRIVATINEYFAVINEISYSLQ